ncbi:transcription termination factor Rho [Paratractidigestivibacter faecalis]|uniref:Transcription termination factor Rho n=1 Tax=Paratractidigestivibacter faecalis TaxID=2292441 RepID=A0ABV1IIG4_9ACTN
MSEESSASGVEASAVPMTQEPAASATEPAEKPKRRRRRTKAEMEAARAAEAEAKAQKAAEAGADPADAAAAEKPKRTRARRTKAKVDGVAEGQMELPSAVEAAPAEAADAAAAEKPKRRRGRPRKVDTEAAAAAAAEAQGSAVPSDSAAGEAPAAESDVRPGRGRRTRARKAAASDGGEAAAQDVKAMNEVVSEATKATSEPVAAPTATLSEADAAALVERLKAESVSPDGSAASEAPASDGEKPEGEQGESAEGGRGRRRNRRGRDRFDGDGQGQGRDRRDGHGDRGDRDDRQGRNDRYDRNDRFDRNNRRRNRKGSQQNVQAEPSLTREALQELKVAELRSKAAELGVEYVGVRKPELIEAVYLAAAAAEGFRSVEGILEIGNEGYGWIRTGNYMEGDGDAFVHQQMIRSLGLRPGDRVAGTVGPGRNNSKYPPLQSVASVNGRPVEGLKSRPRFRDLTPIFPNERLVMEHGRDSVTGRAIDLVSPIGKGQRGLIVSPPKAGKTTVLKKICQSIAANNPEVHLFCLLVDERPEEVTDMERSIKGEVVASTFDMPADNHTHVSELVIEHAKRLVELGEDVVVVLDSITRLARAYNLAQPASGRILSGGVDSAALYPPKKFLGAARNIEGGGSLTIIASALVDTGSKMDEVIFEEFKGTGNMELKLDRDLADRRIFPAIDPISSGTRNEDLLIDPMYQPLVWGIRRVLANMNNTERAANALVKGLKGTETNEEFLIRSAKKAQQSEYVS